MGQELFTSKIDHDQGTVNALYKTRYFTYGKLRMLLRILVGFGLVLAAALTQLAMWIKALMLLVGAWLLISKDFPAHVQADKVLDERKAALPSMSYRFYEDHMSLSGEGSMDLSYEKLSRLVEDERYIYLFLSRDSVCMMERSSVSGQGDKALIAFLEGKTGLRFGRVKSFMAMNFWDLWDMIKEKRGK